VHRNFQPVNKHFLIFALILCVSAYFRLWQVGDNPAWYTDEATHVEIAGNLLNGKFRYFAIQDSWLLFARLPLFEFALAGVFSIFGMSVTVLRIFTGVCGVITTALLYFVVRDCTKNTWLGLSASAVYAILPQAILYNRFGFSYNLLLPLILMILWGYYRYRETKHQKWLILSAACIGMGCISDVIMWSFVPTILFMVAGIRWRDAIFAIFVAIIPFALFAIIQMMTVPDAFLFDLGYTLGRTGGGTLLQQIQLLNRNYLYFLQDRWWIAGIIGLVMLENKQLRYVIAVIILSMVFVGRTVPLYSLSAYYVLPFLPFIAIGIAGFLHQAWGFVRENFEYSIGQIIVAGLIAIPILYSVNQVFEQVNGQFITEIDAFLIDADDAGDVADFINANRVENDLVITSAPIGWMIDAHVADFQMAAIADGQDAIHLPGYLPENRYAFAVDYQSARYVVIDDLWRNWGVVHIPQIAEMVDDVGSWELVFEAGSIRVYEQK